MSQFDYIKDIAKYSLDNDQEQLQKTLQALIDYSLRVKKTNFALQLQSILKEASQRREYGKMAVVTSSRQTLREMDKEIENFVIEKLTSDYRLSNLVCSDKVSDDLGYFLQEQRSLDILNKFDLPVSNKVLLYGPSGCGKTLASYVLAGELQKMMLVVNLGAIVSSKLGETSKNLSKLFKVASNEGCIIFFDEFDSLGKIRDYDQDHGEMKRVVNTILQLFDFLPKDTIVIAATNQMNMIDDALLRRFDLTLKLDLPNLEQIQELVTRILSGKDIVFDNVGMAMSLMKSCVGLSYYVIQRTLLTALKRTIFEYNVDIIPTQIKIDTSIWKELIDQEFKNKRL